MVTPRRLELLLPPWKGGVLDRLTKGPQKTGRGEGIWTLGPMLPKHVRYRTAPHPVELTFCNGVYYTAMRLVCQHFFSIFLIYFLVFNFSFLFLFILFSISIFVFMHNLLKNRAVQCRNASNNPLSVLNIFNIIRLFDEIKLPFTLSLIHIWRCRR